MWELLIGIGELFLPLPLIYWYLRLMNVGEVIQNQSVWIKLICLFSVQCVYIIFVGFISGLVEKLIELSIEGLAADLLSGFFILSLGFVMIAEFDLILNQKFRREVPLKDIVDPDLSVGMVALVERKYTNSTITIRSLFYSFLWILTSILGFAFVALVWGSLLWMGIPDYLNQSGFITALDGILGVIGFLTMTLVSLTLFWNGMKPVNSNTLDS